MKIKLPIIVKKEIVDGKLDLKTEEREFEIDTSLACQMRWEAHFPEMAKRETFVDYATRIGAVKSKGVAEILAEMKAIYCLFETEMSFTQFVKLFDISKKDYVENLVTRLKEALDVLLETSAEKN